MDWEEYKKWLYDNKSRYYARFLLNATKKWSYLAFSNQLVELPNDRRKEDVLKSITNLTRYFDIKYDTEFHGEFLHWMKKKELKWKYKKQLAIQKQVPIQDILNNINKLDEKYKTFCLFALVSGLRTFEVVKVMNNHKELCNDGVIEMYWDRGTKKSNAVYCHPNLHDRMNFKYYENTIHRMIPSEKIGCQIKYLRKLNYTINATKIDPLLAEFMQGRRGNVSQRHYFLPLMNNNKRKWTRIWTKIISK